MCDNMANICYFHSFTSQIRHKPAVYCRKFVQLIEYMEVKGNTMLSYGERLDAVIDYLRMSYTEFATTLQINRGTLYEIKGGRHSLRQIVLIQRIKNANMDLNTKGDIMSTFILKTEV